MWKYCGRQWMNVTVRVVMTYAFKEMLILRFNLAVTVAALQAEDVQYTTRIGAEVAGKKNLLLLPPPPPPKKKKNDSKNGHNLKKEQRKRKKNN
jgi:hypothetical protein